MAVESTGDSPGNPRLYKVPVAMGWRDTPMSEGDLNPQALYV